MYMNAESPEVIYLEDFFSEEYAEEISGPEILSESSESVEELSSDTSDISQEPVREITIRPSVIQKLEKGQQQSLEFVHKIESGMKKINPLDIGQATNNGKKPIRPPVICNAPASCVSERSYDRPVATTTARLPLAVCLDSFSKCDPNTVHKHLEQLDTVSRNPMPSAHVETPVSYKNPKELNRKFVCVNSDKLVLQKDVKSQGVLSPGFKFCELKGTENSVRVKSSSRLPVNSAVNLNKTYKPSDKGIFEDTTPKHHEEFFSNMDCSQEEEHLIFKKTSVLKQKCSVSSEVKFDYGPLQSASDQSQEVVQDLNLWKEEQVDQEDENCESGGSEMSFDCDSSCHSLTDQSDVSDREINLSEEIHADLPLQNNKSYVSKRSSDRNDSVQGVTNQPQVIVKEVGLQNTARISLVDQSYETSGSEMNSDCDEDLSQSANVEEVDLPQEVRICLVDKDYGCSSSESSADSIFSLESEVEDSSVVVTEKQVWKKANVRLVDASYGSSSEASSDCDASPQSVADRPQMTVKGKKPKHRHIHLKHRKRKSSRAKAHLDLDCDVSLETVADEPQRAVEEKKLLKEKNADLLDMNCESHGPEMGFHADAQLVADQSQVAVKEVNAEKVDNDLESVQSSISYLSFDSHAFLYDQPQGDLGEVNLKELNVDMEVKSYGCSSSELTFDSDSPLLSVTERFQLDVERIKEDHINLEDESCESNSSDITFDSDIPDCSVVDQPQVADYEEEPFDLENKSNESCISEITFDSDIPLHSGNDQPEVAVEVIIQEEEYVHLERKNDKPNGSEINLDSYAPLHSVTNPPEVADKKLSPQKEEQVLFKNKENEPADSKLNLAYDTIFPSMTGHSEDPIKDINFQKEEYIHLENKFNELSISKTRLDSNMRLQSVIKKPEVVVKNIWLPKEKHAEFQGKNAEFSGSKINSDSDIPHYSVAEPQVAAKRKEKRKHLLEESPKCDSSQLLLNSDVLPQSIIKKPQLTVLKKAHVDPEGQSTELKGFKMNLNVDSSLHSVTDQPQLALLKEKHVDLKDKSSKPSNSNISFNAIVPLQTAPEQRHIVAKNINLWKEETIGLDAKNEEPSTSKAVRDTVVSFHSRADQSKVAIKQINLESEDQMYLEIKNSQYSSETSLDPDFLVQATVDRPQITILEPEHLEGKHSQSCDSEVSFDSDDSLQSVADQLRETVKEISLWKDEDIDMEDKRDETESFKIMYGSDVLQPAADQTKEVVQRINLWKEHVDLEDKTVKSGDSKINFDSDKPLQSVTNKAQELVNKINLQREGRVCLDDKGYEPDVSRIIYVPNIPHQSVIQQPQILEEEHASLEVKSSDPCGPEIRFDSGGPSQSVAGQLQKTVKEINLKEDHIYLEDKSYKLVDCEACYDSDVPVQFVADQSHLSIKEINLQKKNNNDLENKNYIPCCSEIRCDSGVHLQSEVDPSKVVYKETDLQKRELLGMEEKSSEPSDSEMMYDSDVSFQIVVNPSQMSDGESDSPQVVFVDVVASDSDCDREVISDSNIPVQLVTDPSHMTIPETSYINAESVNIENNYCNYCGSQLRNVCEASQSVTNQPKESFRIINRKNDYIILGDSTCQSCGYEIDFNGDASDQSMTYQSQGPDRKCIDSEDERGEGDGSKRNFNLENTSQPVTHQLQHADQEVNVWKDQKDKSWDSSASAVGSATPSTSGIHQTTVRKSVLKRRHTDSESTSCKSCGSEMQGDSSHHSDQCQEAMKKRRVKRVTFDLGEKDNDSQSDYVPMADSVRNVEKAKVVINDSNEPVLEASPHVPPSFVGKTWSQIIRENDIKINALVKEFKEGRFRCYFDDDSETKKVSLSKQKKTTSTWSDFNQSTASVQTVSNHEDIAGGIPEADQFSVALEKSCCHVAVAEKFLPKQNWQMASPSQTEKVSHGTQTSFISYPLKKRKIVRQEEESPKKKCLQSDRKEKKKVKIQMIELPASHSKVLDPVQPRPLVRVLSSLNLKPKEGESCSSPKANHCVCDNDLEFLCKYKQSNRSCPSLLKIVNNLPPNLVISAADMCKYNIHLHEGDLISTAGENDAVQNLASTSHVIIPARYELRSRRGTGESSVFLENSEVNASEVSEEDNFQLTLLSRDVAKISPKLVRNEFFESKSKKKTQRRNVTTSKTPSFPKRVYKTIILRQKARITPEKWSIWNRTKANDIIRKYISKYSTFLRHRYQSRTTFIGMQLKKKSVASRLEDTERSLILLDTSVPPAGAKEKLRAIVSPLKQSAQHSSNAVGRKKPKKSYRRKKKRPRPVREYDLRSSCYIPDSDRMMTRLASKLKSNEVK